MGSTQESLLFGSLVAILAYYVIAVVAWLVESKDHLIRKQLDKLHDGLEERSLFEATIYIVVTACRHSRSQLAQPLENLKAIPIFMLLNYCSFVIAVSVATENESLFPSMLQPGGPSVMEQVAIYRLVFLLAIIDIAALQVTTAVVARVHRDTSLIRFLPVVALEFVLTAIAIILAMASLTILSSHNVPFYDVVTPLTTVGNTLLHVPNLLSSLAKLPAEGMLAAFLIVATAAIPIFAFLAISLFLTITRPKAIWKMTQWLIYRASSDKTPVLKRAALIAAAISGILGAISKLTNII